MTLRGLAGTVALALGLLAAGSAGAQQMMGSPQPGAPVPGAPTPAAQFGAQLPGAPQALVPQMAAPQPMMAPQPTAQPTTPPMANPGSAGYSRSMMEPYRQAASPQYGARPMREAPMSPYYSGGYPQAGDSTHLGVASCTGSNCHSAAERPVGSPVTQNQFLIWSTRDKHRNAYNVLLEDRAIRMAKALGYPDAANQKICLDCHADNVPADRRGREFQLSDGVGCEACHGGASRWLGVHIAGVSHQANLAAGMYPTEKPIARAEKCLSCHFGDSTKFVNHRLYGAGHPRLTFEADTYTALEPAHFVVDRQYIERKGLITDAQVWATGQAIDLAGRMDALLDPKNSHQGPFPEPALFDCQSCHHPYDSLHAPRPTTTGLGPGTVKLNDAYAVMLRIAATRVAPGLARNLVAHMDALHRASNENWSGVQQEAAAVRRAARDLAPILSGHQFTRDDLRALAAGLITAGLNTNDIEFSHAEQTTLALESLVNDMSKAGYVGDAEAGSIRTALNALYQSFSNEQTYQPQAYQRALHEFQGILLR